MVRKTAVSVVSEGPSDPTLCFPEMVGGFPLRGTEALCFSAPWPMDRAFLMYTDVNRAFQCADLRLIPAHMKPKGAQ